MDRQPLKQIIIDQQGTTAENTVTRSIYKTIQDLENSQQIIVITGIRRCGKSTLLQQIRQNATQKNYYFNFDDDRLVYFKLEDFSTLVELFIELYGVQETFYFDEIQNVPNWERFIRRLHDQGNKIYITGSNATMFSKELGTKLTGRHIQINMYPFSFSEYVNWQSPELLKSKQLTTVQKGRLQNIFANYFKNGGMPEFLLSGKEMYLTSLYESILYRDIVARYKINERIVKELAFYLASNMGKEITYNSLRKMLGVASPSTISDYCGFLENSFLCYFVHRYAFSLKQQSHYAKKVFFIDHALTKMIGFRISEDNGRVLENIVFLELKRRGHEIYFHKNKYECDFLTRQGIKITNALQVSLSIASVDTKQRELQGLLEALEQYDLQFGYLLTENESGEEKITHHGKTYLIHIIPVWQWLLATTIDNPKCGDANQLLHSRLI
jgi:uncharacterized protein